MVLISKQNRRKVYAHLFNEGVMVVEHAPNKPKHEEVDVPNLHAYMLLRSLTSRAYCTEIYNWRWHYYFLTNEGIEFLRQELHLPAQVFPQTLTKKSPTRSSGGDGDRWGGKGGGFGRGGGGWGGDKPEGGWGKGRGKGWGKGKGEDA